MNLTNLSFKLGTLSLPLYYYRNPSPVHPYNFGDELSFAIVRELISQNIDVCDSSHSPKLLALGSILHFASNGDTVWGSGINGKARRRLAPDVKALDVRAVRGPLTKKYLIHRKISCPEIYGDPGLLFSTLFPQYKKKGGGGTKVIGHYHDHDLLKKMGIPFISTGDKIESIVNEICTADFIISTALHGIVVAESIGVPACYLRLSNKEHLFKFHDYYEGTGRKLKYASNISKAEKLGGGDRLTFDAQKLMDAFPYDKL